MKSSFQVAYQYDAKDGEITVAQRRKGSHLRPYVCFLQGGLLEEEVIEELPELSSLGLKFFLALARRVNGNIVMAKSKELAHRLRVSVRTLDNTMVSLRKHRLVYKLGKDLYVLNPRIVWRGNDENYANAVAQWDNTTDAMFKN